MAQKPSNQSKKLFYLCEITWCNLLTLSVVKINSKQNWFKLGQIRNLTSFMRVTIRQSINNEKLVNNKRRGNSLIIYKFKTSNSSLKWGMCTLPIDNETYFYYLYTTKVKSDYRKCWLASLEVNSKYYLPLEQPWQTTHQ